MRVPRRAATVAAGAIVIVYALADRIHDVLYGRHFDRATLRLLADAIATKVVRVGVLDALLVVAVVAVVAGAVFLVEKAAAKAPPLPSSLARFRGAVVGLVLVLAWGALLARDLAFAPPKEGDSPLFWHRSGGTLLKDEQAGATTPFDVGTDVVDANVARLVALTKTPPDVKARETKNILLVHVESLRADMLNPTNMPKLSAWKDKCWSAERHYSTSINTGGGMFGALSGLDAHYYAAARRVRFGALPLRVLAKLGYESHLWFANEALRLDRGTELVVGDAAQEHAFPGDPTWIADKAAVAGYLAAAKAGTRPRFDYVTLDATHYDYVYPPEFERFTPTASLGILVRNGVLLEHPNAEQWKAIRETKGAAVFNKYKDSVLFADAMLDELLRGVDLDKTIVAIFGDHGEEFWDQGVWGHSTKLDEPQSRTPLVLCPGPPRPIRYRYTSHADILPTIFDWLGIQTSEPITSGKSLLAYDAAKDLAIVRAPIIAEGDDPHYVVIMAGKKLSFIDAKTVELLSIRDEEDRPLDAAPSTVAPIMAAAVAAKLLR